MLSLSNKSMNDVKQKEDESEIFYEALDTLQGFDVENVKSPKKRREHKLKSNGGASKGNDFLVRKAHSKGSEKLGVNSLFSSKKTDFTESNVYPTKESNVQLENLKILKCFTRDSNKKLSEPKLQFINEFNNTNNELTKSKMYNPIAMNINNNLQSKPKINLNFNISINCDNTNNKDNEISFKNTNSIIKNNSNKVITERYVNNDTPIDTIYETARNDSEDESDFSGVKMKNRFNFDFSRNNEDKESTEFGSDNQLKRKITNIKFKMNTEIDLSFLRKNLKIVHVKNKQVSVQNRHFRILLELQNFEVDTQQVWIVKMSHDGRYLATGGKTGILKIFEIMNFNFENYQDSYCTEDVLSYLKFINEKPFRVYNDHSNDIIDICWSTKSTNILLTASLDHLVIMWDIDYEYPVAKFNHSSIVTCICFYPSQEAEDDEKFISGCLDKIIRIWSAKKNKVLDYINIKEYITAITYLPTGDMIAVGTHNGRISVYDCRPKLRYNFSFTCRNRMGKFSYGRKITHIEFVNRTQALVTTNDSRIRLVNISDGKLVQKYKGHLNEEYMTKAYYEESHDLVISASEDGHVCVWSKYNKESPQKKNYSHEFFRPFIKDTSSCSFFINDEDTANYLKKFFNLTTKVMIHSILINASVGGRLQVLINCDEMDNV